MKLKSAICLLALGASVNACGTPNPRWGEEVQLSDGRVIVVEREIILERGGAEWVYNREGVKPKEYRIRFAALGGTGPIIEWKSIKRSPQTWPESPLIFDIESGQPVVYSIVHIDPACEVYLKYRYQDGRWQELRLPDRFEQRMTNLLFTIDVEMPKFVTLQKKRLSNAEVGYRDSFRQVGPDRKICG